MFVNLSIIVFIAAVLLILLNKNFAAGLGCAVFLLVSMPVELFIETGGALPILSVYRAVIVIMLLTSIFKGRMIKEVSELPLIHIIVFMFVVRSISLFLSTDFNLSLKPYLGFIIETVILYIIMANAIKDRVNIVVLGVAMATVIVAAIGVIERYTDFNPVNYIPIAGRQMSYRHDPKNASIIYSVYNHPIHLGTGLAMGWPICLAMMDRQSSGKKKYFWGVGILLILACLYFTLSRGPWLAFILSGIVLIWFGYPKIIRRVAIIFAMAIVLIIARPGVYNTIDGLYLQTTDPYSLEGGSFRYRFELWKVAYQEISKSPERFAFGYGEGTTGSLGIVGTLSYGQGRDMTFQSWDNDLAATLLEMGIVGLMAHLILYVAILKFMIHTIKMVDMKDRIIIAALMASVSVYLFMTTNVRMSAPTVNFLLWINIAAGWGVYKTHISKRVQRRQKLLMAYKEK